MLVIANTPNNVPFQMELPFNSFVEGPLSSHLVQENTDPYDVLAQYLPDCDSLEVMEDAELYQTVEQACLNATSYECREEGFDYLTPVKVLVDDSDIAEFKQRFFSDHGMALVEVDEEPTVA